jgi:hypothetical protein
MAGHSTGRRGQRQRHGKLRYRPQSHYWEGRLPDGRLLAVSSDAYERAYQIHLEQGIRRRKDLYDMNYASYWERLHQEEGLQTPDVVIEPLPSSET